MVMGEGVGTGEAILANKQLGGEGGSGGGSGTCCPDTKTKFAREEFRRFGCFVSDTRFACHLYVGNPHPRHAPEHRGSVRVCSACHSDTNTVPAKTLECGGS